MFQKKLRGPQILSNLLPEEAKKILSSIEADHKRTSETIAQMVETARSRAGEEEEKAKKNIEELMKNNLISAEGQVR